MATDLPLPQLLQDWLEAINPSSARSSMSHVLAAVSHDGQVDLELCHVRIRVVKKVESFLLSKEMDLTTILVHHTRKDCNALKGSASNKATFGGGA